MELKNPIVVENASGLWKAGFSASTKPDSYFPAVVTKKATVSRV